jgi:tRNA A-37 threonylcarbamoyl transferase component Bud32
MMRVRYEKQKKDGWDLRIHPDYTAPEFVALCSPEGVRSRSGFEKIRDSRNTLLFRFNWNGKTFYHKEFKSPTPGRQLRKRFRAFHQIRVVAALRSRGLVCPDVLCAGRKGTRIFCVYEGIAADGNAPGIYNRIVQGQETRMTSGDFLYEFGKFTGTMHRQRVAHGDYQWGNVLVQFAGNTPSFVLIDNDRTSTLTGLIYWYRLRNLIQLMHAADYVSEDDWKQFWVGYTKSYSRGLRWKPLIERMVQKRVAQRRQESAKRRGIQS